MIKVAYLLLISPKSSSAGRSPHLAVVPLLCKPPTPASNNAIGETKACMHGPRPLVSNSSSRTLCWSPQGPASMNSHIGHLLGMSLVSGLCASAAADAGLSWSVIVMKFHVKSGLPRFIHRDSSNRNDNGRSKLCNPLSCVCWASR